MEQKKFNKKKLDKNAHKKEETIAKAIQVGSSLMVAGLLIAAKKLIDKKRG